MSHQNTPAASSQKAEAPQQAQSPFNFFTELGRCQLAMLAKSVSALCQGSETLRTIQQSAAHEASARHAEMAQKLFDSSAPADLMAMQTEVLRHDLQSASKYWQQLATQMMQTQVDMMRSVSEVVESGQSLPASLPIPLPIANPLAGSLLLLNPLAWTGGMSFQDAQEKSMTQH